MDFNVVTFIYLHDMTENDFDKKKARCRIHWAHSTYINDRLYYEISSE